MWQVAGRSVTPAMGMRNSNHSLFYMDACLPWTPVELRETCQAADVSVAPTTESGRDSIFRSAVTSALASALESGKLAGVRPQQFVAGVAKDLGARCSLCAATRR